MHLLDTLPEKLPEEYCRGCLRILKGYFLIFRVGYFFQSGKKLNFPEVFFEFLGDVW